MTGRTGGLDGRRCGGKRCYPSWEWAAADAWAINRKESGRDGVAGAYWCRVCRCFHAGHVRDRAIGRGRPAPQDRPGADRGGAAGGVVR